jgi:hypothetical protein
MVLILRALVAIAFKSSDPLPTFCCVTELRRAQSLLLQLFTSFSFHNGRSKCCYGAHGKYQRLTSSRYCQTIFWYLSDLNRPLLIGRLRAGRRKGRGVPAVSLAIGPHAGRPTPHLKTVPYHFVQLHLAPSLLGPPKNCSSYLSIFLLQKLLNRLKSDRTEGHSLRVALITTIRYVVQLLSAAGQPIKLGGTPCWGSALLCKSNHLFGRFSDLFILFNVVEIRRPFSICVSYLQCANESNRIAVQCDKVRHWMTLQKQADISARSKNLAPLRTPSRGTVEQTDLGIHNRSAACLNFGRSAFLQQPLLLAMNVLHCIVHQYLDIQTTWTYKVTATCAAIDGARKGASISVDDMEDFAA